MQHQIASMHRPPRIVDENRKSAELSPLQSLSGSRNLIVDEVYSSIKSAILAMELLPGAALVESRLSAELGVSKTPIREALTRLAQEGLAEGAPFRGYRVTSFTADDARSVMEIRAVLEGLAARRACEMLHGQALAELTEVTRQAETQCDRKNWAEVSTLVHRAHTLIYQHCGDQRLTNMINMLSGQFERARLALPVGPGRLTRSVADHSALLAAIQARKPKVAETVMRRHLVDLITLIAAEAEPGTDSATTTDKGKKRTSVQTVTGVC